MISHQANSSVAQLIYSDMLNNVCGILTPADHWCLAATCRGVRAAMSSSPATKPDSAGTLTWAQFICLPAKYYDGDTTARILRRMAKSPREIVQFIAAKFPTGCRGLMWLVDYECANGKIFRECAAMVRAGVLAAPTGFIWLAEDYEDRFYETWDTSAHGYNFYADLPVEYVECIYSAYRHKIEEQSSGSAHDTTVPHAVDGMAYYYETIARVRYDMTLDQPDKDYKHWRCAYTGSFSATTYIGEVFAGKHPGHSLSHSRKVVARLMTPDFPTSRLSDLPAMKHEHGSALLSYITAVSGSYAEPRVIVEGGEQVFEAYPECEAQFTRWPTH